MKTFSARSSSANNSTPIADVYERPSLTVPVHEGHSRPVASHPLTPEQKRDAQRLLMAFERRQFIDRRLTQEELAHACGWRSQGSVHQYLHGKIPLNLEALLKFSRALDVDPEAISPQLARKLLPEVRSRWAAEAKGALVAGPAITGRVPLISWVQAGGWTEAQDQYEVGDAEEWVPSTTKHGRHAFALRVRGASMENPSGRPSFGDGDVIIVDPDREPRHRSLVIARLPLEQEATFKQLMFEGSHRYLRALNPFWPNPITELPEDAQIVGVVISKIELY